MFQARGSIVICSQQGQPKRLLSLRWNSGLPQILKLTLIQHSLSISYYSRLIFQVGSISFFKSFALLLQGTPCCQPWVTLYINNWFAATKFPESLVFLFFLSSFLYPIPPLLSPFLSFFVFYFIIKMFSRLFPQPMLSMKLWLLIEDIFPSASWTGPVSCLMSPDWPFKQKTLCSWCHHMPLTYPGL